jgi:predicted AAA+ superfamily ATPase
MIINRTLTDIICDRIAESNKINVIYGARQTGKTTMAKDVISRLGQKSLLVNADEMKYIDVLSSRDSSQLGAFIQGYNVLFIDEAQRIPNIGVNLKIIYENFPYLKVLVTGSFSLSLFEKVKESLAGRKWVFQLYPISINELKNTLTPFQLNEKLGELMVYGSYPEVYVTNNHIQKQNLLDDIVNAYLYKDIFELADIKHKYKIRDLLKLLAWQIGSIVSLNELSNRLGISRVAIENYIDMLEQSFVIFRLPSLSNNPRNEISKSVKIYFTDLGIRNALINNFNSFDLRNDIGALWENFVIVERMKTFEYQRKQATRYFWRTYSGTELDLVEERDGGYFGYEIKYKKAKVNPPAKWVHNYPGSEYKYVNRDNYLEFIGS